MSEATEVTAATDGVERTVSVFAVDASPAPPGKTYAALEAVLASCARAGAATSIDRLHAVDDYGDVVGGMLAADAIVLGSPTYRASCAWPLKVLLDRTTRDVYGDGPAVLRGKAVATVMTSASPHHFLAVDDVRSVLAGFFAAHVVPPGLSIPAAGFGAQNELAEGYARTADALGRALVELALALRSSPALRAMEPQV